MQVTIKFFASSREIAGMNQETLFLPESATVQDMQAQLFAAYPTLPAQRVRFAVNLVYASPDTVLHEGDEVACIPPLGGG